MSDGSENPNDADRPSMPLPPDDRLWRHPSEVGSAGAVRRSPPVGGRVITTLAVGTGVFLVLAGAVLMVGWLTSAPPKTTSAEEPIETHVVLVATSTTTTTSDAPPGSGFLGVFASDDPAGVRVTRCERGSPAAEDLQVGDVIVAFDGTTVTKLSQLVGMLHRSKAGSLAQIDIDRGGTRQTVSVRLAQSH